MDDGPWFCSISDEEIGPLDANGLKELARSGAIHQHDKVRLGHDGRWKLAVGVAGLFDALAEVKEDDVVLGDTPYVQADLVVDSPDILLVPDASLNPETSKWSGSTVTPPPKIKPAGPLGPPPVRLQLAKPDGPPPWVRTAVNAGVVLFVVIILAVAGLMIYWGSAPVE